MRSILNLIAFPIVISILSIKLSFAADPVNFEAAPNGLTLLEGLTLGPCSAVDIDSQGRLYLFHRGPQPILCFDRDGKFVRSWGDDLIRKAHGLRIDKEDNVWVTDIGHQMVFKFSPTGKLLLGLGQLDKPGDGTDQFNQPTDIAFGPDGTRPKESFAL